MRIVRIGAWLVVAWLAGCSSTQTPHDASTAADAADAAPDVSARDAEDAAADLPVDCGYPEVSNDPQCPATYPDSAGCGQPCSTPDLHCSYPGAGDGTNVPGCYSTAIAWCTVPLGADADAGSATKWICAQ
jgi:hypothetical protein